MADDDVIELHEMPRDDGGAWSFGRAILSKGLGAPSETVAKRGTTKGDLAGIFGEGACHSTGLFSNLSRFGGERAYDGALYGGAVRLGELRCGGLAFSRPSTWTGRPLHSSQSSNLQNNPALSSASLCFAENS